MSKAEYGAVRMKVTVNRRIAEPPRMASDKEHTEIGHGLWSVVVSVILISDRERFTAPRRCGSRSGEPWGSPFARPR